MAFDENTTKLALEMMLYASTRLALFCAMLSLPAACCDFLIYHTDGRETTMFECYPKRK